jgi:UDP-N-acetylglucosamine 2-epimerase (non-hydrolysing)
MATLERSAEPGRRATLRVLSVFGTRPEAVKMAPVVKRLIDVVGRENAPVCVTGQHREMLDQVLATFGIEPAHDLDLMREDQSLAYVASEALRRVDAVIGGEKPDWVLVQGDTTTAMATGLAAFYRGVRLGHVEAGLRSHHARSPFPEEANRRLIGALADLHFAPTDAARANLLREGVPGAAIRVTGNTVVDALQEILRRSPAPDADALAGVQHGSAKVIVVTAHRRENWGAPLASICEALKEIARRYGREISLVYPVHRNPRVRGPVERALGRQENILLLPPLEYRSFLSLLSRAYLAVTDSGGIQEEGASLGVPVLLLRDNTERPEGIEAGRVRMVSTDRARIVKEVSRLLDNGAERDEMAKPTDIFGDGQASLRIVRELVRASAGVTLAESEAEWGLRRTEA